MNFNPKKHKTLVTVFVLIVIAGLVLTYVPYLFSRPAPASQALPSQTASLTPPKPESISSTVEQKPAELEQSQLPDGFSGLNEENLNLDEIDELLNNPNQ